MVCCLEEKRLVLMFDFTSEDHTMHQPMYIAYSLEQKVMINV